MMKKTLSIILALAMLLTSASLLISCNENGNETSEIETSPNIEETSDNITNDTDPDVSDESDSSDASESEISESESVTETDAPSETEAIVEPDLSSIVYDNGEVIKTAGIKWNNDAFALKANKINESSAVTVSAEEMLSLLIQKDNETDKFEGKVFRVTEPLILSSDTKYYGNMSALIAEQGIIIKDAEEIVIKELIVKGDVIIENSNSITFFKIDIQADGVAVNIDSGCSDITFKYCRMSASRTALLSEGINISVYQNYLCADNTVISSGDSLAVQDCHIVAKNAGVSVKGSDCIIRECLIEANPNGIGIDIKENSRNALVALNILKDAQMSVKVVDGFNCVVLLNSAIRISAEGCTNIYVNENKLGGAVELRYNDYLLCDGNDFLVDGKIHPIINTQNSNYNGDDLHDVDARVEYGANEDLLPHTNKELFVGMERSAKVTDLSFSKSYKFNNYIRKMAKRGSVVIIPPGAYATTAQLNLEAAHANTTIYAYGVYQERQALKEGADIPYDKVYNSMGRLIEITGANITIKGLTMGYDFQSSGQVYILEKFTEGGKRYIRVVTSAGYIDAFGQSDTEWFIPEATIAIKGDELSGWRIDFAYKFISQDEDGTMLLQVTDNTNVFNMLEPGDILGCRLSGSNNRSISLMGKNSLLKDCVLYGYSRGLAIASNGSGASGNKLERFHNTTHSAPIIDEEIYNKYIELEKKYGMVNDGASPTSEGAQGLEVYIDELGRYRGGLPRLGSVDGTHIFGAAEGVSATSCIFEQMVDDASNQRGDSSRVAGVIDNGNGTTTIYYKGSLARVYFNDAVAASNTTSSPTSAERLRAGDTIFAYASNGHILTEAKVSAVNDMPGTIPDECHIMHTDNDRNCICDREDCKAPMHTDVLNSGGAVARDCICDKCGKTVHTDFKQASGEFDDFYGKGDGICDNKRCNATLSDLDNDGKNDSDGDIIIHDMAYDAVYDASTSRLTYKIYAEKTDGTGYVITYSTPIRAVTVKTSDVDFSALDGIDIPDNDYFMADKIICDNISLNSKGFTFDNVMMRNYLSRGMLMKTVDSSAKHCTFKNIGYAGVLMSTEVAWSESTVPKNITIESCLFDNTVSSYNATNEMRFASIAIQGIGDSAHLKAISEKTLPCRNISIIGNKFVNTNKYFVITVTAAQNITIKDNVIEGLDHGDTRLAKAIYIDGCMNVEISGNRFEKFNGKTIDNIIVGWNYQNLYGSDVEGVLTQDKAEKRPTY